MDTFSSNTAKTFSIEQAWALSPREKVEYFKSIQWAHSRHREVLKRVWDHSLPNSGTDIVLLVGPAGVGKTTLLRALRELVVKEFQAELQSDSSFLPIVIVDTPSTGEKSFSWRMFYREIGSAMDEPLLGKKYNLDMKDGRPIVRFVTAGSTVASLKAAIENVLKARRTMILALDEAVHMFSTSSEGALALHARALQSLSSIPGLTLVLVGSYDLLAIPPISGQLARRIGVVHYSRYSIGETRDEKEFSSALQHLMNYWVLSERFDVSAWTEKLHRASLGCVGLLKKTLDGAFKRASEEGKWKDTFLKESVSPPGIYQTILSDTLIGESLIENFTLSKDPFADFAKLSAEISSRIKRLK